MLDLEVYGHMQSVVIYPLTTADIYSDAIRKQTESASSIEITLEDTMPGKPPKGSVSQHVCVSPSVTHVSYIVSYCSPLTAEPSPSWNRQA